MSKGVCLKSSGVDAHGRLNYPRSEPCIFEAMPNHVQSALLLCGVARWFI
jgi:hypothetical protein